MSADLLQALIECGTPAKLVAQVASLAGRMEAAEAALAANAEDQASRLAVRRANDAARQRKCRGRHAPSRDVTVTERDIGQKKGPPDPLKENNPPLGSSEPTPQGAKAHRLPDDFEMPADWLQWAMAKRRWNAADAREEAECFCRYWQAKGGREAAKRSWRKTWENWVVNSRRAASADAPRPASSDMVQHILRRNAA